MAVKPESGRFSIRDVSGFINLFPPGEQKLPENFPETENMYKLKNWGKGNIFNAALSKTLNKVLGAMTDEQEISKLKIMSKKLDELVKKDDPLAIALKSLSDKQRQQINTIFPRIAGYYKTIGDVRKATESEVETNLGCSQKMASCIKQVFSPPQSPEAQRK